jgi:hypothetical protein
MLDEKAHNPSFSNAANIIAQLSMQGCRKNLTLKGLFRARKNALTNRAFCRIS